MSWSNPLLTQKRARRKTRLQTAALNVTNAEAVLQRSLVLQTQMFKTLKQFATGSNWASTPGGGFAWLSEDDPVKLAQKCLDNLVEP